MLTSSDMYGLVFRNIVEPAISNLLNSKSQLFRSQAESPWIYRLGFASSVISIPRYFELFSCPVGL